MFLHLLRFLRGSSLWPITDRVHPLLEDLVLGTTDELDIRWPHYPTPPKPRGVERSTSQTYLQHETLTELKQSTIKTLTLNLIKLLEIFVTRNIEAMPSGSCLCGNVKMSFEGEPQVKVCAHVKNGSGGQVG